MQIIRLQIWCWNRISHLKCPNPTSIHWNKPKLFFWTFSAAFNLEKLNLLHALSSREPYQNVAQTMRFYVQAGLPRLFWIAEVIKD